MDLQIYLTCRPIFMDNIKDVYMDNIIAMWYYLRKEIYSEVQDEYWR